MESKAILQDEEVLKLSALFYLKEALVKQEYEACAELVAAARKLGAQQSEISEVLAAKRPANRLRALKEG